MVEIGSSEGFKIILPGREERGLKEGHLYGLAIVGGGPAGLTAAVYAARKKLDALLISKDIGARPCSPRTSRTTWATSTSQAGSSLPSSRSR